MTDDVFVYMIDIPGKTNEMIAPCQDGYTVYIDDRLSPQGKLRAYYHAIGHPADYERDDLTADEIEAMRHG